MRPEPVRVAIDLETTGLRPEQDAIIEIGAVKFAGARIVDTFESFVNITSPLPYRIHRLTGITSADLRHAPLLGSLLGDLRAFLGSAPLVGHSVSFDAAFLRKVGLAHRNPLIDTYELASLLLPSLPSYTLASVADALNVTSTIHHRALADADLSRAVFLALMERLDRLDTALVNELAATPSAPGWTPAFLLKAQARDRAETIQSSPFAALLTATRAPQQAAPGMSPDVFSLAIAQEPPLASSATAPTAIEATEQDQAPSAIEEFMSTGGALLLEVESTDEALIRTLSEIARGAGAGGQTLLVARDADEMKRIARDLLPVALKRADRSPADTPIAELDEREGYLCLSRWFGLARDEMGFAPTPELTRGLAKLAVWTRDTTTGMRTDVALSGGDAEAWSRVRSGPEFADTIASCPYRDAGLCFADRAARRASSAAITVTTHAALATALAEGRPLLDGARRTILLDGRQFEDEALRRLTSTLDVTGLLTLLDRLASPTPDGAAAGLLPTVARMTNDGGDASSWAGATEHAREMTTAFFTSLRTALQDGSERGGRGEPVDGTSLRIDDDVRSSRAWGAAQRQWRALKDALSAVSDAANAAAATLGASPAGPREHGARADLLATHRRIETLMRHGDSAMLAGMSDGRMAFWLSVPQQFASSEQQRERRPNGRGQRNGGKHDKADEEYRAPEEDTRSPREILQAEAPALYSAPIQIGPLLAPLLTEGHGVAAIGWALSVGGDFDYVRVALGFPEHARAYAASPDYASQTLLCLPDDAPEPNAQSYTSQLEALIVSVAQELKGNLVAIFPSHAALRSSAIGIRRALERHDILALAQGIDGSARQLWNTFNAQPRTVLLGAGGFWDGRLQGARQPACIVVTRTPFPPQSQPLVAARSEQWSDQQAQFNTPQAALKLRQALGGLAWSAPRRNAIILFDKRLQTRSYGDTILGALPNCTISHDSASDLADRVSDWVTRQPTTA